jgi:hypothetical protein
MVRFDDVRRATRNADPFNGTIIGVDPGHTTGIAVVEATFDTIRQHQSFQVTTWPLEQGVTEFTRLLDTYKPRLVVFERYAVYEWKAEEHSWSEIPTVQVIGCLKTLCIQKGIPTYQQTAQQAKQFVTDDKLEAWGFYERGKKHARDAMRHAIYYLLFGPRQEK